VSTNAKSAFITNLSNIIKIKVLKAIIIIISKTYVLVIIVSALATILNLRLKRERPFYYY
jgi:hypothetical protein